MTGDEDPKEFPDVSQKLSAPKKISAFEKERQAAEDKRRRAEAENAAALKAFQDSFAEDDDDDPLSQFSSGRGPPSGPRGGGYVPPGRRYGMPPSGPRGPGDLGSGLPPGAPPSLKRKRALDEMREVQEARRGDGLLGYEHEYGGPQTEAQEEEREDETPRPTVHLSNLPPGITSDELKLLLAGNVKVHTIRFLPPAGPGQSTGKRSLSAIATLSPDTTTGQVDTAVGALKDKYMGCGFYLSISRHLSSAALHPSMSASHTFASNEPFGAQSSRNEHSRMSLRHAPPPAEHRRGMFAPPDQFDPRQSAPRPDLTLSVLPPVDIATIKAIHTIAEQLLVEPFPDRALEKEAMLMSLPEVQKDERFAFLYDSKSPAGVYYRFLLWAPDDPDEYVREQKRKARGPERLFDDISLEWLPPYNEVPFPDLDSLAQVVTDIDYVSSEEESDDEDGERKFNNGRDGDARPSAEDKTHLTPLQRSRLVHLLSRLPTTNTKLRKGDVARLTNFAIAHAGAGAEEIVDLLLLNIDKPFAYSLASKYEEQDGHDGQNEDEYEPDDALPSIGHDHSTPQPDKEAVINKREDDPSNAKLIALYVISDILSASSTAGARNAWKYRQLFEAGFATLNTFERLGRLEKDLGWGRLKAEQWKRKIGVIFGIWEGWSAFSGDIMEGLRNSFFEQPPTEEESKAVEAEEKKQQQEIKWMSKFKKVEGITSSPSASPAPAPSAQNEVDGEAMIDAAGNDIDGEPMDADLDGAPMDDDLDGAPMEDDGPDHGSGDVDGPSTVGGDGGTQAEPPGRAENNEKVGFNINPPVGGRGESGTPKPSGPKKRMRAEDMFADSDED